MPHHEQEILRLLKGTPDATVGTVAHRLGVDQADAGRHLADLESAGRVRRQGERWIVVEEAASAAPGDQRIA